MEKKVNFIDDEIVTLYDDQGNPVDFYEIALINYEDQSYALLQPTEEIDGIGDDEAIICRIEEQGDEDLFLPLESEELMQNVFNEYLKAVEEYGDECDCDCEECNCDDCDCDDCHDEESEHDEHCDCGCKHNK